MLIKKMLRDFKNNKGTYLASLLILILGNLLFVSFALLVDNVYLAQTVFYEEQNFADGFAKVRALPPEQLQQLRGIPGIAQIEGRLLQDVQLYTPDQETTIYLRLVSWDTEQNKPLNGVHLLEGVPLQAKSNQIWLDPDFFAAHDLQLNDCLSVIVDGEIKELQIVGTGMSPEFVYALRGSADLYPFPETFGIAFVALDTLQAWYGSSYNDLVFKITAESTYDLVQEQLETSLKPYGLISLFSRDEQSSHLILAEKLKNTAAMALALPLTFLIIAGLILYISLKRLGEQQRSQIGILKALGYSTAEILRHYLTYALVIGFLGSFLGGLLGIIFSGPLTDFYLLFFKMPLQANPLSFTWFFLGLFVSVFLSMWAGYQGCKEILTLEPAVAMRPPAPFAGQQNLLEKIFPLEKILNLQSRMALRNLIRNKGRSVFIFLGILFCFALSSFTWSMNDLVQQMLFDHYELVELHDVKITTTQPLQAFSFRETLSQFPGVYQVEPLAEIPITLEHNWLKKDLVLKGIMAQGELYRLLDHKKRPLVPPQEGLLLSERLASLLQVSPGSTLKLTNLLASDEEKVEVTVVDLIPQYIGINAYMELTALQNLLQEKDLATTFLVTMDQQSLPALQNKFKASTKIATIEAKEQEQSQLEELMATFGSFFYIYALLGAIIGLVIIYSTSVITLSERNRELASLLVLGMSPREVLGIITREQWFLAGGALLLGFPVAKLLLMALATTLSNDLYTIPANLTFTACLIGFLVTVVAIGLAQQIAARKMNTINPVEILKSKE